MMKNGKPSTLRKTNTFVLQKNLRSMSMSRPMPPGETVGRRSSVVDFPISPQLIYGDEMVHFSHPRHPLSHVCLPDLFTCGGCKEYGAGKRFTCAQCDFQLHEFCALSPPVLKAHPFHSHHQLLFYSKPVKGGIMQSKCDVCAKPIKGFAFRCCVCSFQMHPCCGMMSLEMNLPSAHPHPLRLVASVDNSSSTCGECKRRRSGRVYRCSECEYQVHAVCAKNMINGVRENGHSKGTEKASMLGTAAKLASQVVVEFLGGIIEGIGEGVGEALVQNIKGKGPSHR